MTMDQFVAEAPLVVGQIYYQRGATIPRFDSVFKKYKEYLKEKGIDYKKLNKEDQNELYLMVEDVYWGIRNS